MLRTMASRSVLMLMVLLGGCATQAGTQAPAQTSTNAGAQASAEPRPVPSRDLLGDGTFGELVKGLALEETHDATPRRCLLAHTSTGYRMEAGLAIAVHPIPAPPEDLDIALEESGTARMLSRWGRHGLRPSMLTLAALTDAPPTRSAWALVITDRGLYLRAADEAAATNANAPFDDAKLGERLHAAFAEGAEVTLFVSAERDVALQRIEQILRTLAAEHAGPIALAVALAPETALPAPRSASAAARRCPDGLPASSDVEGDLPVAALTEALVPLRARAASCLEHADARGAAGGRLLLGLRVSSDGNVDQACMIADETEDNALAACVLAAAHDLRFPVPYPRGIVDVELPLLLRPNSPPAQAAVCEPTQAASAP